MTQKNETLGERLKSVRGHISQKEFAKSIDVSLRAYQSYEQNIATPKIETLANLHTKYGVDLNQLVTGKSMHTSDIGGKNTHFPGENSFSITHPIFQEMLLVMENIPGAESLLLNEISLTLNRLKEIYPDEYQIVKKKLEEKLTDSDHERARNAG